MTRPSITVDALRVSFGPEGARQPAVRDVTFAVAPGEILAIVGESGSGKSATAMALARLNEGPATRIEGRIVFGGHDVLSMNRAELRELRARGIAMVFQDAMTALNPCETVGDQIAEAIVVHGAANWTAARGRAVRLLAEVGLPEPARRAGLYPHELSGGQRQRAMIALALACDPGLLIADEPTTALDVTVQSQILALMTGLVQSRSMAMILITHDLGVVAGVADRVAVMYAGQVVEDAPVEALFEAPRHPYTRDLIAAARIAPDGSGRLVAIEGAPPRLGEIGQGCAYAPRCRRATERCAASAPPVADIGASRTACWHPVDADEGQG